MMNVNLFYFILLNNYMHTHIHTHIHTYIYIWISVTYEYIFVLNQIKIQTFSI